MLFLVRRYIVKTQDANNAGDYDDTADDDDDDDDAHARGQVADDAANSDDVADI